jgi:hypothetical protein
MKGVWIFFGIIVALKAWRIDYNEFRPHSSLGDLSPLEYVNKTEKILIHAGL